MAKNKKNNKHVNNVANLATKKKVETPAVETKKEEVTPQVDNKQEEAKKPVAPASKAEPKKEEKPAPKAEKKPKKEEHIPEVLPEEVHEPLKPSSEKKALERAANLVGTVTSGVPLGSSSSSLDGKAMLSFVMWDKYGKNEELQKHYPELYNELMRSVDVVTLLALVDVRQELLNRNEKGELSLTVDADQILPLQNMAGMLGITLSPAKALPNSDGKQMVIDFNKAEIPEELKDAGKKVQKAPELDPKKITTNEELISALSYLINQKPNVAENLANTVEWYRVYCINKETDANKKLELDDYTVQDWMNQIFCKIQPQCLLKGLGRSVYLYSSQTGSPCMAHALLHTHLNKCGWSEEQVASTLKALIGENFRYSIKDEKSVDSAKDNKAILAISGSLGSDYIDQLLKDFSIDLKSVPEKEKNETENRVKIARMTIGTVMKNYFGKDAHPKEDELRMTIGRILNLYRDPAERLAEYEEAEVITMKEGEYPEPSKKK